MGVSGLTKSLVIVESPAKAKTIGKFLGSSYHIEASMGHLRDLPKSQLGVNVEDGFEPKYIPIRGKGDVIKKLRTLSQQHDRVLLATDPDREGEAIAWHLTEILGVDADSPCRISFNEITRQAVRESVKKPRPIDRPLVDAQQTRRVLDRLVGYKLSPLLWRKVRRGLSAGRVQSVAVRILCDREEEIERFVSEEYWTVKACFEKADGRTFQAEYRGTPDKKVKLSSEKEVERLLRQLDAASFHVAVVNRRDRRRNPAPPFITSTLQQEAARKLGFSPSRTMRLAQELYEGMAISGEGHVGLITYMRTDSTRVSSEAKEEASRFIEAQWGKEYLEPRVTKARAGAQDAHEAIRPTSVLRTPDSLRGDLGRDQMRLYRLIWQRFVASMMSSAVYDTVTADIDAGGEDAKKGVQRFRATGSTVTFPGFTVLYVEGSDEVESDKAGEEALPPLEVGEPLRMSKLEPEQHWTQPPARFTEASLIKELEQKGIGRPSTYAPIVETIVQRGYVAKSGRTLTPTELGCLVTQLLKDNFPEIVDVTFTARMEADLDAVAQGGRPWREVVSEFYGPFSAKLIEAETAIANVQLPVEEVNEVCDLCGKPMVVKHGRFGPFLSCSGYPECKATKPILTKVGVACPKCGGEIVERRSRKGRHFYGCSNYPGCDFVSWDRPVEGRCPDCGALLVEKVGRGGRYVQCSARCGYRKSVREEAHANA